MAKGRRERTATKTTKDYVHVNETEVKGTMEFLTGWFAGEPDEGVKGAQQNSKFSRGNDDDVAAGTFVAAVYDAVCV